MNRSRVQILYKLMTSPPAMSVPQAASIPKVRDFLHETVPVFLPLTPGNGLRPTMDALRFKADPGQNNRLRGSISNSV